MRIFRGWKYTTVAEKQNQYRYWSKKELIKEIVLVTAKLNGFPPVIDAEYEKELRQTGKRALIKALLMLQIAHTKKLQGVRPCPSRNQANPNPNLSPAA